jgi:hypothetical protein
LGGTRREARQMEQLRAKPPFIGHMTCSCGESRAFDRATRMREYREEARSEGRRRAAGARLGTIAHAQLSSFSRRTVLSFRRGRVVRVDKDKARARPR